MHPVTNLNLGINTYGYGEASLFMFIKAQSEANISTYTEEVKVYGSHSKVVASLVETYETQYKVSCIGDEDCTYISLFPTAVATTAFAMIVIDGSGSTVSTKVYAAKKYVGSIIETIGDKFTVVTTKIHWYYGDNGNYTSVPVDNKRLPITEMYPGLGCNLADYYDNFMRSSASILILIGPPGTGKTSFLRGLLSHTQSSACVSYDTAILERDSIFVSFISGESRFMILEDSDSFLSSRSKGNTIMHRFLNVSDGLISSRDKKVIFTTNLPSAKDIDPALLRPGRCHEVLHFPKLTPAQCSALVAKMGLDVQVPEEDVTMAELLNGQKNKVQGKVGFV